MDHQSKTATIRDLLTFLVNQLEITVTASHQPPPFPSKHNGSNGGGKTSSSSSSSSSTADNDKDKDKEKDNEETIPSSSQSSSSSTGSRARGGLATMGDDGSSPSIQSYLPWLTYQLRAMALLIELARGCCLTPSAPPAPAPSSSSSPLPNGQERPAGGTSSAVLSPEEADNLLRALVRTADYFLRMYRLPLSDCLAKSKHGSVHGEGGNRGGGGGGGGGSPDCHEADHLSSPVGGVLTSLTAYMDRGTRQIGALELVQELRNGFTSGGGSGGSNSADQDSALVAALHHSVVKLREELLVTYFRFNLVVLGASGTGSNSSSNGGRQGVSSSSSTTSSSSTSDGPGGISTTTGPNPTPPNDNRAPTSTGANDWRQHQLLVNECGACVARHFEILFPSDSARVAFITMLSQTITARPPEESATTLQTG